jgi:hypothetical protein
MTQSNPKHIQDEIDRTREDLSSNVNALADKVSPNRIVGRRIRRTKAAVTTMRERVMGASTSATDSVSSAASTAGDAVSSAASTVVDAAKSVPSAATEQTQGNPIAAGLIAFGVGWLVSSLLPASNKEQYIAEQVKDKVADAAQPLVEQAQQSAKEIASNLQQPAHGAVDQVRSTAHDAVGTMTDEAKEAGDIGEHAKSATRDVTGQPWPQANPTRSAP